MFKKAPSETTTSDSLPPIASNGGSNITQLRSVPPDYAQKAAMSDTSNSSSMNISNVEGSTQCAQQCLPSPAAKPESSFLSRSLTKTDISDETSAPHLPLTPKPPSVPKLASSRQDVPSSLPSRLTREYVQNWTPKDCDINRCVEDVEFTLKSLREALPACMLNVSAAEYTLHLSLLTKAVRGEECSDSNKAKIVQTILDSGFVTFIVNCFQLVHKTGDWTVIAIGNLVDSLEILHYPVWTMDSDVACQIFNQYFDVLYSNLNHPTIMEVARGPTAAHAFMVVKSLLFTLRNFMLVSIIPESKIAWEQRQNVVLLLTKYTKLFKDKTDEMRACNMALSALEKDECELPPLSLNYCHSSSRNNPDQHEEHIAYVTKRLSSISMESHLTKSLKYQTEFVFVVRFLFGPDKAEMAHPDDAWHRYYSALLKDDSWYKLLTNLHVAALEKLKEEDGKNSAVTCALQNVLIGFDSMVNATDRCKDPNLQQRTFDQLFEYMFNHIKNPDVVHDMNNSDSIIGQIATSMVIILHNLSYYHELCIPVMREKGMIAVARLIRECSTNPRIMIDTLLIIAFLIKEGDDKKILTITDDELGHLLKELQNSMLSTKDSTYHPEELIDGLNRVAVSDINKLKLMECGILKLLEKSFDSKMEYSVAHKTAAAKAVWNLAFSDESRKAIKENAVLVAALKALKDSPEKELRAVVSGALWQLEGKEKHVEAIEHTQSVKDVQHRHIMLSYNHQAKVEVFRMRDRLKEEGYKVWIDEEQITAGGSTLEAMSKAIEDSCLVLIFFSEPYKNSVNCRAEAEYVFERRKPFLPVQVQAGYTPEGWLGILFGSKYRYTLSKPDRYDSEVTALLGKVREHVTGQLQPAIAFDVPDAPVGSAPDKRAPSTIAQNPVMGAHQSWKCESWSPQEISEWFDGNGLNEFKTSFSKINGEVLAELATLSCHHKDTFYTLLMSNKTPGADLSDVLMFGRAVQKLAIE